MENVNEVVEQLIAKGDIKLHWLPIDEVLERDNNPRYISPEEFEALKQSIAGFPEMLRLRPGVVDAQKVLLGATQRKKACKELGWELFPVIYADDLTEEQLKEFIVKDNMHSGDWDWDKLKEDWGFEQLEAWGMRDFPEEVDLTNKNQEIDINNFKHQMSIKLTYDEAMFLLVKQKLAAIAETPELAICKLLELK